MKPFVAAIFVLVSAGAAASAAEPMDFAAYTPRATAVRISHDEAPKIDGDLSDPVWAKAVPITEFYQVEPVEGAAPSQATRAYILYDDKAIYVGLYLYDTDPERIARDQLVLLTDGANTAGEVDPIKAAELARQVGLRIYTIGIGAEQMEVASLIGGRRPINPSADLDEDTLTEIARLTGGRYFRATDTASLQDIYKLVDELEPVEEPESGFRPVKSYYFVPLGMAVALVILLSLTSLLQRLLLNRIREVPLSAG